jgi:hypothetical protein
VGTKEFSLMGRWAGDIHAGEVSANVTETVNPSPLENVDLSFDLTEFVDKEADDEPVQYSYSADLTGYIHHTANRDHYVAVTRGLSSEINGLSQNFYISDDLNPGVPLSMSPSDMPQSHPMYLFYTVTRTGADVDAGNHCNQIYSKVNKRSTARMDADHDDEEQTESSQTVSDSSTGVTAVALKPSAMNPNDAHSISSGDREPLIGEIGFTFKRLFNSGWYDGRVVDILYSNKGEKLFSCRYEDNDREFVNFCTLQEYVFNEKNTHNTN